MKEPIPIKIGERYGSLTIIKELPLKILPNGKKQRIVLCRCDCGKEVTRQLYSLRQNKDAANCGCAKRMKIESGTKIGRLTVIEEMPTETYVGGALKRIFRCKCDCGNECFKAFDTLRRGIEPSCGCADKMPVKVGDKFNDMVVLEVLPDKYGERWMRCQCEKCGHEFTQKLHWLRRNTECPECQKDSYFKLADLPTEIWKDVEDYEGLYKVSNMGRIKSLEKPHKAIHGIYIQSEKILSPRASGRKGYVAVALQRNYTTKQVKIHQLVAKAFCPNPNGYVEVNHIDEDKKNNRADNLEWCSRSYNVNYGTGKDKRRLAVIIPVEMLDDYGNVLMEFDSRAAAARYVGVDGGNIGRAIKTNGKSGGYYWRNKQ